MPSKEQSAEEILKEVTNSKSKFRKQKIDLTISKDDIPEEKPVKEIIEDIRKDPKAMKQVKKITKSAKPRKIKPKVDNIKKIIDDSDKYAIRKFIIYSCVYGVLLNFALFVMLKIPFTFYSWIGWGIGLWFIENKLVSIFRRIIRK